VFVFSLIATLFVGFLGLEAYQRRTGTVLFSASRLSGVSFGALGYDLYATTSQSLTINLQTGMLFEGAQLMIDALGGPYMLIAGFALGVAILGAVFSAIRAVRF
jgi:hypothetical protein